VKDGLEKEEGSRPLYDGLEKEEAFLTLGCIGSMRCRKECWLPLNPPCTFDSSWPNLLLGLVKPNFSNSSTHCLTYYSRKQGLNNGPILLIFYCSLIHLFKSSHLLWPMWRVWEAHVGLSHLGWSLIGSFLACPLLLGLFVGFGIKMHVGHGLSLEHDLGLGVGPSYMPLRLTATKFEVPPG